VTTALRPRHRSGLHGIRCCGGAAGVLLLAGLWPSVVLAQAAGPAADPVRDTAPAADPAGAPAPAPPQVQAPSPPADWGPVSISLEDLPYPHPVEYLSFAMHGQDVRLAYMDVAPAGEPNGEAVVLLHGLNFFGEYWTNTIEALRGEGFRVIVPDQVGFGRSSKPIMPYTFHDMAANTRALLAHLGVPRAAVVGHSMGGMLATRFAFSYPEATSHVVLVNMIGLQDARLQRPWRNTEDVYRAALARGYEEILRGMERYYVEWDPAYEKYVRVHYGWTLSGDWPRLARIRALLQQMVYTEPVVYEWPHVQARALVIGGEHDGPDFPELARGVADAIPQAELVLLEDVGHNPHLEAPERFHAELLRFLRSARAE
jgi:pimeloyl-ACP methyl ester carboxylesterase